MEAWRLASESCFPNLLRTTIPSGPLPALGLPSTSKGKSWSCVGSLACVCRYFGSTAGNHYRKHCEFCWWKRMKVERRWRSVEDANR